MSLNYAGYWTINNTSTVKSVDYLTYGYTDIRFGNGTFYIDNLEITDNIAYVTKPYVDPTHNYESFVNIYYGLDFALVSAADLGAGPAPIPGGDIPPPIPGEPTNYSTLTEYAVFANSTYFDYFGTGYPLTTPDPINFIDKYIGIMHYNRVSKYVNTDLTANVLVSRELPDLPEDCFEWHQLQSNYTVPFSLNSKGPYVIAYKYVINYALLVAWFQSNVVPVAGLFEDLSTAPDTLRVIYHLPYIYKLNTRKQLTILYPSTTTNLKVLDKVIFDTGINFTKTIKKYTIEFIELQTDNLLLTYNTIDDYKLFGLPYLPEVEYLTEQYSGQYDSLSSKKLIRLDIPPADQGVLFNNRNYYILIKATDLIG
jgi:hypothetical protein